MKISLDTLVSVHVDNTRSFCEMNRVTKEQIEKYLRGQFSKFSLLRAKVYSAQDKGKIEKEEMVEILAFCNENTAKCEKIADNFNLFKVEYAAQRTYANFNHRLDNLLRKEERK